MAVHQQLVANQRLLERWRHEPITRAGVGEDGEMDPEEEKVEDQRNDNETDHSGKEVLGDSFLRLTSGKKVTCKEVNTYIVRFSPVQEVPKVNNNSKTDSKNSEDTVDLGRPSASHEKSSGEHPSPPVKCEFTVESS